MAASHDYLKRTATADANLQTGRYALLGSEEPTGIFITVSQTGLQTISGYRGGVLCRYVDTSNWLMLVKTGYTGSVGSRPTWSLIKRKEGTETVLASGSGLGVGTLSLFVGKNGAPQVFLGGEYASPAAEVDPDPDLVQGAKLGKGKYGIYDAYTEAAAKERQFRAFQVITAASDPVMFANLEARLSSQGHFRKSADNLAYGSIHYPGADLPRIPVSGREARPVEIGLRPSRGDFATLPDAGLDKVKAVPSYRPCWSFVPESS